jgi:ectoine hydroxylase-related dioxygenase (phytanoyl-CoA dioxygenase family)
MRLTEQQLREYEDTGFLLIHNYFSNDEITKMKGEAFTISEQDMPGKVREKNSGLVRALHGCHLSNEIFSRLTKLPRMLQPVEQIVGSPTYVYQFKINFKMAFGGDVWKWHQDYIYWMKEDGMARPSCTNALIFLDDVNEFNGPLLLIPGSHRHGLIDVSTTEKKGDWKENFSADLKYSLDKETVAKLVQDSRIVAPKGEKGAILFFHPNVVHGSAPNISPFNRTILIVTYNSVNNVPPFTAPARPDFIVSRDTRPLVSLAENHL